MKLSGRWKETTTQGSIINSASIQEEHFFPHKTRTTSMSLTCAEFHIDLVCIFVIGTVQGDGKLKWLTTAQDQFLWLVVKSVMGNAILEGVLTKINIANLVVNKT